ncbi:MAG: hypothetical protein EOP55_05355 [Sphingobacteriales bacterium]|nr:MAG: hypothetical protein EOP55_05355 [Sphingobacteriales bacterium]
MKNFLLIIIASLFFFSCKKEIPEPDVVKLQVYATKIKYTNYNEPHILYWYLRKANQGGYFFYTSTRDVTNFSDCTFSYSKDLPKDLTGKSAVKDIVVWINQLNGDIYLDITGRAPAMNAAL